MPSQLIARGKDTWLIRIFMGRDKSTGERKYYNKTIHGSREDAAAFIAKAELDLGKSKAVRPLQFDPDDPQWKSIRERCEQSERIVKFPPPAGKYPRLRTPDLIAAVLATLPETEWLVVTEARFRNRRIDVLARNTSGWTVGYEIKASVSDFCNDVIMAGKRGPVLEGSNQFFYAAPKGMIEKSWIPQECGFLECDEYGCLTVTIPAPERTIMRPQFEIAG